GLDDEARAVLQTILKADARHAGARERLAKLGAAAKPATKPPAPAKAKAAATKAPAPEEDDLAADLAAELAAEVGSLTVEDDAPLDGNALDSFQVPASEVLGEFRAKLQEVVRPEDVQTHYDL